MIQPVSKGCVYTVDHSSTQLHIQDSVRSHRGIQWCGI